MKSLIAILFLVSSAAMANELAFTCKSSDELVKLQGQINEEEAAVKIIDTKNTLFIRDLERKEFIELERSLRKKENQYSFAKFYSDFNTWQDVEFSLPKTILDGSEKGSFAAFITVYVDDGDRMVPGEAHKFLCKTN